MRTMRCISSSAMFRARLMASVIHTLWERDDRSVLILPANLPIDDLRVQELSGKPQRYAYVMTLREFIKPVEKSYELTLFSEQAVEATPLSASLAPPQPLAAVLLEYDPAQDTLFAVGMTGGELFDAFFRKYEMKLSLDYGANRAAHSSSRPWSDCSPVVTPAGQRIPPQPACPAADGFSMSRAKLQFRAMGGRCG